MQDNHPEGDPLQDQDIVPETEILQHAWTQMEFVGVEVLGMLDNEGEPVFFPMGTPELRVGCLNCNIGLTALSMSTSCLGYDIDEGPPNAG